MDRGDAAEVSEGGFGGDPFGVVAGGDEQERGGVNADAVEVEQARCGRLDEVGELAVKAGAVGVDVQHAATEVSHRQLGGIHHRVAVRPFGRSAAASRRDDDGDTTEPFPQLIGGAEAEMAELVETLRPRSLRPER